MMLKIAVSSDAAFFMQKFDIFRCERTPFVLERFIM